MNQLVQHLTDVIRQHYPDSETDQLQVVNRVMAKLAVKTHIQKLHGGGLSELAACKELNLNWENENARGADAHDSQGRAVELKTTEIKAKSVNCNINYVYPKGVDTVKHYAESPQYAGGHYWVGMNTGKTEVLWTVTVSQARFAQFIRERLLACPTEERVNFGSTVCKTCRRCPRIDKLVFGRHTCNSKIN
jgi:hypothetical protein